MPNLFQVTEREITQLASHELRPILNDLLLSEARQYGIPASSVEITSQDNVADGGIDAKIDHKVNVPDACRIPTGLSVWQYKAGDISPGTIKTESQKPGIQDAIANNGSYCFVLGQSCTDPMRRSREDVLDQAFKDGGKLPKRRLITAAEIADWVSDYPVIARRILRFEVSDEFYTFEEWDNLPQSGTSIEFQANESRTDAISGVVNLLNSRSEPTSIRLIGADGSGKTRLMLEAIRAANVANLTFYASTPDALPTNFFSYVASRSTIHRLILVVDECDDDSFRTLWQRAHRCNGRVILITIGSGELTRTGELERGVFFFLLDNLTDEAIRRVVQLAAPTLHAELQYFLARSVDGYIKLATALAESITQNQDINTNAELMTLPRVEFILRSLWRTTEERDAMYALSLLRYVGLDDEVEVEGQAIAKFLNLDLGQLKRIATQMQHRGLVIKKGRFRYVTPSLLATWFAKALWEAQSKDIIVDLLPQLPSMSARFRVLERLGDIGDEQYGIPIVEALFGQNGTTVDIETLDNSDIARLFNLLTNASPTACMGVLEQIFKTASRERLLEFKKGRRDIIHALEGLLRRSETFYPAARMLLRLADAENETWANNASGIWQEIFFTQLGLSTFPAWERHSLIQEAISPSNNLETRLLGIKAIHASLSPYESSAYGDGPGGHFSQRWQPQSDDILKTRQSALKLLDQVLKDQDERVAQEALTTFIGAIRLLLQTPLKNDALMRVGEIVKYPQTDSQKKQLVDMLGQAVKYESNLLTPEEIATIQQWREDLLGSSYHDRLHRWIGELNSNDRVGVYRDKDAPINLNEITSNLAYEGYNSPTLLRPELEWLTSLNAYHVKTFAVELGRLDKQTFWLTDLQTFLPNATHLIAYYLYGKYLAGQQQMVESLLDTWVETNPECGLVTLLTVQQFPNSEQQIQRLITLVKKGWLPLEYLAWLEYPEWLKPLSETRFMELLQPLADRNEPLCTATALGLISEWLPSHQQHSPKMAQFILAFLDRIPYDRTKRSYTQMGWLHWQEICLFYLPTHTENIVNAATKLIRHWEAAPDNPEDERIYVLREALQIASELTWSIIGEALLNANSEGYNWPSMQFDMPGRETLDTGTLIEAVELPVLVRWLEANKPAAARTISRYIQVERTPLPATARELLIHYGDDEIVRRRLHPHARGMIWWGSNTGRLEKMLNVVQSWLVDENQAVRKWASEVAEDIKAMIRREKPRDEEDDLLFR